MTRRPDAVPAGDYANKPMASRGAEYVITRDVWGSPTLLTSGGSLTDIRDPRERARALQECACAAWLFKSCKNLKTGETIYCNQ